MVDGGWGKFMKLATFWDRVLNTKLNGLVCVCVGFSSGSLAWELWNNCVIFALPQPPTIEKLKSVCIQLHQLIAGSLGASKRRQTSRRNAKWGNASDS